MTWYYKKKIIDSQSLRIQHIIMKLKKKSINKKKSKKIKNQQIQVVKTRERDNPIEG
jgi:hypothetical protein